MVTSSNKHGLNSLHRLNLLATVFYRMVLFFSKSERNALNTSFVIQFVKGPREDEMKYA